MAFRPEDIAGSHSEAIRLDVSVIGARGVSDNLSIVARHIQQVVDIATEEFATKVLNLSHEEVPYQYGTLHDSGRVQDFTVNKERPEWAVVYDAEYAAAVHETPKNYVQDHPGAPATSRQRKWKYLEDPFNELKDQFPGFLASEVAVVAQKPTPAALGRPRLVKKPK